MGNANDNIFCFGEPVVISPFIVYDLLFVGTLCGVYETPEFGSKRQFTEFVPRAAAGTAAERFPQAV